MGDATSQSVPGTGLSDFLFIVSSFFFLIAPLSIAREASGAIKWTRVGMSGAITGICPALGQSIVPGPRTLALWIFAAFFVASAAWSQFPGPALMNKSLFLFAIGAGISVAASVNSLHSLRRGLNIWTVAAVAVALAALYEYRSEGAAVVRNSRLSLGGLNANALGQATAPFVIILCYAALWSRRAWVKGVAILGVVCALFVLIGSGSRGSLLMATIGVGVLLYASRMRIMRAVLILAAIAGTLIFMYQSFDEGVDTIDASVGVSRLQEDLTKDTRSGVWGYALNKFIESPVMGNGWMSWSGGRSANLMNIFLQTGAESGIIGLGLLLWVVVPAAFGYIDVARRTPTLPDALPFSLCAALFFSTIVNGCFESAPILGTTAQPFFLGFTIAMLDKFAVLVPQAAPSPPRLRRRMVASSGRSPVPELEPDPVNSTSAPGDAT